MVIGRPARQLDELLDRRGLELERAERLVRAPRADSLLDFHAPTVEGDLARRRERVSHEIVAIAFAGLAAGTINTVVGSGTLITFPVLLAFGYPPVTANVSNTIGLVPGSVSGAIGYRRELVGQRARMLRLGAMSLLGRDHRRGAAARAALRGLQGDRARVHRPGASCSRCYSRA